MNSGTDPSRWMANAGRYRSAGAFALAAGLALSVGAFVVALDHEREIAQLTFENQVQINLAAVRISIEQGMESIETTGALFDHDNGISRAGFRAHGQRALKRNASLKSVGWAPFVPTSKRAEFEKMAQAEVPGFAFREFDSRFQVVPAAGRDYYLPIFYAEDRDGQSFLGFDVASAKSNREATERSLASGEMSVSARVRLATGKSEGKVGFVLYRPVFRAGAPVATEADRRHSLLGFATSVFEVDSQIRNVLNAVGSKAIRMALYDESAPPGERFLALWPDAAQRDPDALDRPKQAHEFQRRVGIDVGGRNWVAVFTPSEGGFDTSVPGTAWAILAAGMLFSLMLALYLESVHRHAERERQQAISDVLTGLYNRRYLWELLQREFIRAQRSAKPIAAVMIDLDFFKRINDAFGHAAGDLVLKELGALLKAAVRGSDVACRYGGEEFVLVLPDAPAGIALRRAEDIRAAVKRLELSYRGRALGKITASLGVAVFPDHANDPEGLLRAADRALYRAKAGGIAWS